MPVEDIAWAVDDLGSRLDGYRLFDDYYEGNHRRAFASETWHKFFGAMLNDLRENLCPAVVEAPAERLEVGSFDGPGAQAAQDAWNTQRMPARSNTVHREALRCGDSYVLVWPDDDPQIWPHRAQQMTVRYGAERFDEVDLAAKLWKNADGHGRVNLYYDDRVERWVTHVRLRGGFPKRATSWQPYADDDGAEEIRHTFGRVPVVHFPNGSDLGDFGRSELADVVPLQDGLNKSLADMMVSMEAFSLPLRLLLGYQAPVDKTGKPIPVDYDPRRDQFLALPGKDTQAIQLGPEDLSQLLKVQDAFALKVARVTGTPLHYFLMGQGQFPSGEALRTAEARLSSKVSDLQQTFAPQWSSVLAMAAGVEAQPVWAPGETTSQGELIEQAKALDDMGYPRLALRKLGYDEDEITGILAERARDDANAGAAAVRAFRDGRDPASLLNGG